MFGGPDHPFEDSELRHPTYSETMGFYCPISHLRTRNPHRGDGVLGNQCSLPDYSYHGIAVVKVGGLGEPAIPGFNILAFFDNLLLKLDIHYIFPELLV